MGWKDFFRKPSSHYYYGDYYEHPKREEPIRRPEPKPISTTEEKVKISKPEIQTDVKRPDEIKEPRDMGSYFENKHQKEIDWYKPLRKENKDVVIIVVDNVSEVYEYQKEVVGLVNKITQSNKDSFFMVLRLGNDKKFFDVLNYEKLETEKVLDNLLTESKTEVDVDYLEALKHIEAFYNGTVFDFEYNDKKYDIKNIRILFVGTAQPVSDDKVKKDISKTLKELKQMGRIKAIKYFCMEDKQTFNAAKIGMPVIGHIQTDFYK